MANAYSSRDLIIAGGEFWFDQSPTPPRGPHPTEFLIAVTATYFLSPEAARAAVGTSVSNTTEVWLSLPAPDEAMARGDVASALAAVHVQPQHGSGEAIDQILQRCRQMAAEEEPHGGGGVFRLDVEVEVLVREFPDDDIRRGADEDEVAVNFVAASDGMIGGLERVRVIGDEVMPNCVVCLENILAGSEAIRMPCSHQFHGVCIVKWLNTSKFCPLCRFELSG